MRTKTWRLYQASRGPFVARLRKLDLENNIASEGYGLHFNFLFDTVLSLLNRLSRWSSYATMQMRQDITDEKKVATSGSEISFMETQASASQAKSWRDRESISKKSRSALPRKHNAPSTKRKESESKLNRSPEGHIMTDEPPQPLQTYLDLTSVEPVPLERPQQLLIVLDLNGTLILRDRSKLQVFQPRSGLEDFLKFVFKDHSVMVWTSMTPKNMNAILPHVFTKEQKTALTAAWARDSLQLNNWQYANKVQVYKRLHRLWGSNSLNPEVTGGHRQWHQGNTVLIDDSLLKASSEPYNLINLPKFEVNNEAEIQAGILKQVMEYIKEGSKWSDISAYMKRQPFKVSTPTAASSSRDIQSPDNENGLASLDGAFGDLTLKSSSSNLRSQRSDPTKDSS